METSEIEWLFLSRLFNKRVIGGKHTERDNIFRRLKDWPKKDQRLAKEVYHRLVQEGLILEKMSTGSPHVSLNPRKLKEIKRKLGTV